MTDINSMVRPVLAACALILLSGCQFLGNLKNSFGFGKSDDDPGKGTVAGASATSAAVDRMAEIAKREAEARKELEIRYEKFRKELAEAYENRQKIDIQNFDKLSEINYGITAATEEITDVHPRVLIANLKSREAAAILMPVTEEKRAQIKAEIEVDEKKTVEQIVKKYDDLLKVADAAAKRYAEADALVKKKEAEKEKLRSDQAAALKKIQEEQLRERERLSKQAKDAVEIAKETQRLEMIGWIVKSLLGVALVLLVAGFLMKSPVFILSGISMLGLSYVAATIPFWVVSSVMGVFVLVMIIVNPRTGKIDLFAKSKLPEEVKTP